MVENLFFLLDSVNLTLWAYVGFPLILALGLYLSLSSRFVQLRKFPQTVKLFIEYTLHGHKTADGVHPIKAFFACVGGAIGIGNIIAVCTAIQIGGPGALFWIWIVAIFGMIIKYSEVYLGMIFRHHGADGKYEGGPMFFLQHAFHNKWIPLLVAFLLCIYGVEIYQFQIVSESISLNFDVNYLYCTLFFLVLVIYAGYGGVDRVGTICTALLPLFMGTFLFMGIWVFIMNLSEVPHAIGMVVSNAFTGSAPLGGFVGSSLFLAISQGIKSGCYAADVGVGYAAVIHSESSVEVPAKQSSLIFIDLFMDIFMVSSISVLIILTTGLWTSPLPASLLIQTALSQYFPYMDFFMPAFIFILGYSTVISYYCVGLKCAEYLSPNIGKPIFLAFSICFFLTFSFVDSIHALTVMSLIQLSLLVCNLVGTFLLRKNLSFEIPK